jgi:opacity protein-like surface antigen
MKKGKILWMAVIAAMVLVPTMSWAQKAVPTKNLDPSFMVEIYGGGGAGTSSSRVFRDTRMPFFGPNFQINGSGSLDAYALGGLKFGYWFNPRGTYGIAALPDWMKYVGFYTDFSYQKLNFGNSTGGISAPFANALFLRGGAGFDTSGSLATWAFMFAFRYGFLPDSEVPFGRLQPYAAVGPAIFFSYQDPTINLYTPNVNAVQAIPFWRGIGLSPNGKSSINVGLAVESGLRYFFNKSISVQASFKYRMFTPRYNYSGTTLFGALPITYDTTVKPSFNLYSGQVGVAYHF